MKHIAVIIAGAVMVLGAIGCGTPESCSGGNTCPNGGSWEACCTSLSCHYKTSDGGDYPCNGTDCSTGNPSAAQQVANWCMAH